MNENGRLGAFRPPANNPAAIRKTSPIALCLRF
jgi:hypothetical protein